MRKSIEMLLQCVHWTNGKAKFRMFNWFYQAENEGEKMEILQDKEYAHNVTIENVELIV